MILETFCLFVYLVSTEQSKGFTVCDNTLALSFCFLNLSLSPFSLSLPPCFSLPFSLCLSPPVFLSVSRSLAPSFSLPGRHAVM